MRRSASVYRNKDGYYIHSNAQTQAGFWISHGFFKVIPTVASMEMVVSACKEALSHSVHGVPTPTDFKLLSRITLDAFGLKSRTLLDRHSVLCELDMDGVLLRIMPTKKDGKRNFLHLPSEAIEIEADAPSGTFFEALRGTFERCS